MSFVFENYQSPKKTRKKRGGGLQMESVFDFWRDFFQNGRDSALEIGKYGKSTSFWKIFGGPRVGQPCF